MGAVVAIVNLPGVEDDQLKLTGECWPTSTSARSPGGTIPSIVELNPGVTLPSLAIAPVYRADGSGTTFVFTSYLVGGRRRSGRPRWASAPRCAGRPAPARAAMRASPAPCRTPAARIGYVENAYAIANRLVTTQLRNKDGNFVAADAWPAFLRRRRASRLGRRRELRRQLIDHAGRHQPGRSSRPTFILLPTNPKDAARSAERAEVLRLGLQEWRHAAAEELEYIPLPDAGAGRRARAPGSRDQDVRRLISHAM